MADLFTWNISAPIRQSYLYSDVWLNNSFCIFNSQISCIHFNFDFSFCFHLLFKPLWCLPIFFFKWTRSIYGLPRKWCVYCILHTNKSHGNISTSIGETIKNTTISRFKTNDCGTYRNIQKSIYIHKWSETICSFTLHIPINRC